MSEFERKPIAYVEWIDSAVLAGSWEDREAVLKRVHHEERLLAAGFLIDRTDEGIVLAAGVNPYIDDVTSVISIPTSAIRRLDVWAPWQNDEAAPDGGEPPRSGAE